jgi:acetyltransferase
MRGMDWCERLFNPRTVAIVGAGQRSTSMGARYLTNLREFGFSGSSYGVSRNPGRDSLAFVADVPEEIDLCQIAAPFDAVPDLVADCVKANVGVVQVLTAPDGSMTTLGVETWSARIEEALAGGVTRLVGPNCVGVHAPHSKVTFLPGVACQEGGVSFVSQSGGLTADFIAQANSWAVGLRNVVSVGNCLDTEVFEFVDYLAADPGTTSIGLYVEGTSSGPELLRAIADATTVKPVFVLKGGRSQLGGRATATHTGSMAGEFGTWRDLLEQRGAILVDSPDDLLFALNATASRTRTFRSPNAALVGNGGGMTVLMSDALDSAGFGLIHLSEQASAAIERLSPPPGAFFGGATDVPGAALSRDPTLLTELVQALTLDPGLGGIFAHFNLVALSTYDNRQELVESLVGILQAARARVPVHLGIRATGDERVESLRASLAVAAGAADIPAYPSGIDAIRAAGRALKAMEANHRSAAVPPASVPLSLEALWASLTWRPHEGLETVTSYDAERVLVAARVPHPRSGRADSSEGALGVAESIGYPVVVKLEAPGLIHKTENDAVRIGIANPADLATLCLEWDVDARVSAGTIEGLVLQEQIDAGVEVLLGARHDDTFGPIVVVGAGGTLTELIDETRILTAPTSAEAVRLALEGTRLSVLLSGFRGAPPTDFEKLTDTIVRFSQLAAVLPPDIEVECNPVIVGAVGTAPVAVDTRVIRTPSPLSADSSAQDSPHDSHDMPTLTGEDQTYATRDVFDRRSHRHDHTESA